MNRHERVLRALRNTDQDLTAMEICQVIEVPTGSLSAVLMDLENEGSVRSYFTEGTYPRRRLYHAVEGR